jgi:hypothetical protein
MKWRKPRLTAASINAREFTVLFAVVAERIANGVRHVFAEAEPANSAL